MSVGRAVSTAQGLYSASLLLDEAVIRSLTQTANPLLVSQHSSCQPDFFLASISKKWIPRAGVVTCDERVVGIVYGKERLFFGCPTGIIYTDATTRTNVISEGASTADVMRAAMRSFLGHARALRVVLPRNEFDPQIIRGLADSMDLDVACIRHENHSHLMLPSSYEKFLHNLGSRTRRNFRYYRRRFERAGNRFIERVPLETFCAAAWQLRGKSAMEPHRSGIGRALNMLAALDEPMLVGLQAANAEWLSVAGGWCHDGHATLLFQINNDKEYGPDSLSQVLRSYLIEALIEKRVRDLFFWAGCSAPLARYAEHVEATAWYLDSRKIGWRVFRRLVFDVASLFPRRLADSTKWLSVRRYGTGGTWRNLTEKP